jgi:hypothetical protein
LQKRESQKISTFAPIENLPLTNPLLLLVATNTSFRIWLLDPNTRLGRVFGIEDC